MSQYNYVFFNVGQNGSGITVTIGKDVKCIPAYLFDPYISSYSPKITSVIFEEGSICESIGNSAFSHCTGLTSITIPNSVTEIGSSAFSGCSGLTSIIFEDTYTWYRTTSSSYTDGIQTSITNANTNAIYFKRVYYSYYWYKE